MVILNAPSVFGEPSCYSSWAHGVPERETHKRGVHKLGAHFGSPHSKDHGMFGSIWGSPVSGNSQIMHKQKQPKGSYLRTLVSKTIKGILQREYIDLGLDLPLSCPLSQPFRSLDGLHAAILDRGPKTGESLPVVTTLLWCSSLSKKIDAYL